MQGNDFDMIAVSENINLQEKYNITGCLEWSIKAGMQSAEVEYTGTRRFQFRDGGIVTVSYPTHKIYGLFMGAFGHQVCGEQTFKDEDNNLEATIKYNGYFFRKQDYIYGEIKQNGRKVCEIEGNYMGFMNFAGKRYWDVREKENVNFPIVLNDNYLNSDARARSDGIALQTQTVEEAQEEKERLENIQRNDRKLREAAAERRSNNGPKFAPAARSE